MLKKKFLKGNKQKSKFVIPSGSIRSNETFKNIQRLRNLGKFIVHRS